MVPAAIIILVGGGLLVGYVFSLKGKLALLERRVEKLEKVLDL